MPKVSVIVPVYGVEKYIERCARSLFEQTLDDIEFIFVDDCTPDRSIEILKSVIEKFRLRFAEKKYGVRIVRMPTNSGQAAVRRHGIQLATGDYIIHCDSDDWVDISMYADLYDKAITGNFDIVICDYYRSNGITNKIFHSIASADSQNSDYIESMLSGKISTAIWNKLVKRQLYKKGDIIYPQYNMWEDYVLSIQLLYYADSIGYIEKPLYFYYYNENSICNTKIDNRIEQILLNSDLIINFLNIHGLLDKYKNSLIYFKYYCRSELDLYVNKRKYLRMWRNIHPEINYRFFAIKTIRIRDKVKFLSILIGLYPYLINMRTEVKDYVLTLINKWRILF